MISVDEALERILVDIARLPGEPVSLSEAAGRVLAADAEAALFNPAFDVSAMDGYAVRAEDVSEGARLKRIGISQAGTGFSGSVGAGQCVRIFTGAPVPEGADAVVMQERAQAEGDAVIFDCEVAAGRNIRRRGEDFMLGETLGRAGDVLTPQRLALLAAGNVARVAVAAAPRVTLLATGDELVQPGSAVGPDQIIASNSVGLAALLGKAGAKVTDRGIVRDDPEALGAALKAALDNGPDVLITTGGASVGEHDHVQDVLTANGVAIDFWRIALRPGKPLMSGRRGKTLVFGLPGNPVSSLVTARLFVLPAVLALMGAPAPAPLVLPLAEALPPNGARRHFLRGRLVHGATGTRVVPIRQTDSGHLSSLAMADGLIEQAEGCGGKAEGDSVRVHLL